MRKVPKSAPPPTPPHRMRSSAAAATLLVTQRLPRCIKYAHESDGPAHVHIACPERCGGIRVLAGRDRMIDCRHRAPLRS